ncbi:MAG: 3'-5' exonuclease, partial [Planctomycetaceae bacterium]|nr:3'-5' exonuclease [Planctomycetaceae bacterium]
RLDEINNYCRCDVLDTYFVFLRTALLMGWIDLKREKELVKNTRQWLETRESTVPAFASYLKQWQDWVDPW